MDYQHIAVFLIVLCTGFAIGNATQDAQVKQAKERSKQYADVRLAVRNRAGETTYFPIRCFGKLGQGVTAIKKGTKLFVVGELEIKSFTTEEGNKQINYRVTAETYRILGYGKQANSGEIGAAL
jgi:single-stranded DNA-binding protein